MAKQKSKPENISKDHLDKLQKIVSTVNNLHFEIGKIEAKKHSLLHNLAVANDEVTLLRDEFVKEYGSYDINVKDGKINYPKDEK
jgi:hypothetical protein|tara:strand:+ start:1072 stop:1326 length:255 start_codon:yes stop_codon:yes gene_type:complete